MTISIKGYSTAMFATWFFINELDLLLDAGDGITAGLMQKSKKIKHAFISHADRDHLTGLLQLNQLVADKPGALNIYHPECSGSFNALKVFTKNFDPHVAGANWIGINAGDMINIKTGFKVKVLPSRHLPGTGDLSKSFSFIIYRCKQKLLKQYEQLSPQALIDIKKHTEISEEVLEPLLGYSADSPVETDGRWNDVPILIHECTFLNRDGNIQNVTKANLHSALPELAEMLSASNNKHVILSHFSTRYSYQQIDEAINTYKERYPRLSDIRILYPGNIQTFEFEV